MQFLFCTAVAVAQLQITTSSVPTATQYQSYHVALAASGGSPPYSWSVAPSSGVSLPEGMSLDRVSGVVSASPVNGQGGYTVTVQVSDSATPPNSAQSNIAFGVNSDAAYGGCQMFPPDSIYNQRADLLPVDAAPSHQIPSSVLNSPIHPDFGHGFYPAPGGIPFMRVPANQPTTDVYLAASGQIDPAGTYFWPFPAWPNAVIEGTAYGPSGDDHHTLILQSSVSDINGQQTGPCTLYETYQYTSVSGMYDAGTNTWSESAGVHYVLDSNEIAASTSTLDNGAQDSPGIPIVPLLIKYWEVPMGVQHPLRITMPSPTNGWVWPGTGCCSGNGPPQGLLYRLKAGVNWQAKCPVNQFPQAATVLQALQQFGAYMSDHGSAGFIQGVPDVRWDDNDLACIKNFHVGDLEVVNNSVLEVSSLSGQTKPYIVTSNVPAGAVGSAYGATISVIGGNSARWLWSISSGSLPPGLSLNSSTGAISGTPASANGSPFSFGITVTDAASGNASQSQHLSITVASPGNPITVTSVTNSASGASGAVAPGEIVSIKGVGLGPGNGVSFSTNYNPSAGQVNTTLAGTQVFFGSFAAPILYTSATQLNAIVPYEVAGQSQLVMQVVDQGAASAGLPLQVVNAAPGAFTADFSGTGQVVAANQDGSVNGPSNPAAAGSYVTVYFTGGGETNPPGVTGSVTGLVLKPLTQNISVTVGGVLANVSFAGAAPALVDGVNQLNILLANNTPSGSAQPLVITVGSNAGPPTATLVVK
jgi:uncharacterized protein (TIGR03437 family)